MRRIWHKGWFKLITHRWNVSTRSTFNQMVVLLTLALLLLTVISISVTNSGQFLASHCLSNGLAWVHLSIIRILTLIFIYLFLFLVLFFFAYVALMFNRTSIHLEIQKNIFRKMIHFLKFF